MNDAGHSFNQSASHKRRDSTLFVDRYGRLHDAREENHPIKERSGVFAVICARGHILMVRPRSAPDSAELPGGGIKPGETAEAALLREIEEETGLKFTARDISAPVKIKQTFGNVYAHSLETFYRYSQKFLFFDFDDLISPDQLNESRRTAEGSTGFWHRLDKTADLLIRAGQEEIIAEAAQHQCKADKISLLPPYREIRSPEPPNPNV